MISPAIMGPKISVLNPRRRLNPITPERHREEWDWIFGEISGIVDIAAFQDGHVDYEDLETFLQINAELAAKHHIELWTNAETFDRDIPGSMPPIDWFISAMPLMNISLKGNFSISESCSMM